MPASVLMPLETGFEEIEALATVDLLRRAGMEVFMAGVSSEQPTGKTGIKVVADVMLADTDPKYYHALVLPGGPAVKLLLDNNEVETLLRAFATANKWIAAICAAPAVLAKAGLLRGKKAACYPSTEDQLGPGATLLREPVVVDGHIITSRGAGTAIPFALKIIELLDSPEKAQQIAESIVYEAPAAVQD